NLRLASNGADYSEGSDGIGYIRNKMKSMVIPRIDFEDVTVEEAIDFLRQKAVELDGHTLDPSLRGFSLNIRRPRNPDQTGFGGDPGLFKISELKLRNVPFESALKYICDATRLRYKIDHDGITVVPQTATGEDLFTRTFRVPPDFLQALEAASQHDEDDPSADSPANGSAMKMRGPLMEKLKRFG